MTSSRWSELDTLILLTKELDFINEIESEQLIEKLDIIGKLIYGLIKNLESRLWNVLCEKWNVRGSLLDVKNLK